MTRWSALHPVTAGRGSKIGAWAARVAIFALLVSGLQPIFGITTDSAEAAPGDAGSIQFDTSQSYVTTSGDTQITPNGEWTIEGFIKTGSTTTNYFLRGYSADGTEQIRLYQGPAGYMTFYGRKSDGTFPQYTNTMGGGGNTTWTHFVFSQDATQACGVTGRTGFENKWNCWQNKRLTSTSKITKWIIGSNEPGVPFDGRLANLRISNIARYGTLSTNNFVSIPTNYFSVDENTAYLSGLNGDVANYSDVSAHLSTVITGAVTTNVDSPSLGPATYTVTFNGNGSEAGSTASQSDRVATTLTANGYTRTGSSFMGWNTRADGSGTWYMNQGSYPFTSSTTLYAQWGVAATFAKNDGSGETNTQQLMPGVSTPLSSNTFTRNGYAFAGWNTQADGLGTALTDAQSVTIASATTYYAQWTRVVYTVTYAAERGVSPVASAAFQLAGTALTLPTPTRANYQFNGWFTDAVGGTLVGAAEASYSPTSDVTVHAQWTQLSLVGLTDPVAFGTITAQPGNDGGITATRSGTKVEVDYYADTLPANTVITAYLQGNKTHATQVLGGVQNVLLSVVVAWKAPDETVPTVDASNPIRLRVTNPNIKVGARVYSIIGNSSTLLGTATVDGQVTLYVRDDPEIAILNAAPVQTPGSAEFSGAGSVSYPSSDNFRLAGDYTVEMWSKFPLKVFPGNTLISRWKDGSQEYILKSTGNGRLTWFQKTTTGQVSVEFATPTRNAWHHIAAVRSGNTITVYVDGVSAGTATFSGSVTSAGTSPLEIGGFAVANGGTTTSSFEGRISSVRISQSALYSGTFTPGISSASNDASTTFLANFAPTAGANYLNDLITGLAPTSSVGVESHIDSPFPSNSPVTPSEVQGTSNRGNSSYITWTGSPLVANQGTNTYTVYGSMDGITFSPMTGCVDVTTTNCTATGLTLARGYVFRATATNNAGTSDYSLVTATANYMFMLGNYGDVPCVENNLLGTSACGMMSNSQPYTTAVMPAPNWCTSLDGSVWITDELGVFDADGSMYFVHGNSVRKFAGFNPSHSCTSTLVSDSPLLKSPAGNSIGLDAAGNIYVSNNDASDKSVIKISQNDSSASVFLTTAETGGMVEGIKFDSDQNMVGFINYWQASAAVVKFMNGTKQKRTFVSFTNATLPELGGNKAIRGISLNAFDDVTVSFRGGLGDVLVKFDAAFDQGSSPAYCAYGCSTEYYNQVKQWNIYDPAGTLYPNKYPSTMRVFAQFQPYTWAEAAVYDSEGNIWIGQEGHARIIKLDPQGKVVLSATTDVPFRDYISYTEGAKIDPNGNVWVRTGNTNPGWIQYPGATKPFLRQLTYKGLGSTPYGSAKSDHIHLDGATGAVTFKTTNTGSFAVASDGAVSASSSLQPGKYVVSGTALDSANTAGTWTYTLTVVKALPTVTVTASPSQSVHQQSVTFTASVSEFDEGTTLTFKNGLTTLGTCSLSVSTACTVQTSTLAVGSHVITAEVAESTHYQAVTSSALIHAVGLQPTSVTYTVSTQPTVGQDITLSAQVTSSAATGTVSFKKPDGTVLCTTSALVSGAGSCVWSGNPGVGTYSVTAVYSGDAAYETSTSSSSVDVTALYTVTFSTGASSVVYRTGSPNGVPLGLPTQAGSIFAGWYDDATNGTLLGMSGTTFFPASSLTAYPHWSTGPTTTLAVTSSNSSIELGGSVTLTATPNQFDANTAITFTDGGTTLGTCSVISTSCSIVASGLATGAHSITAEIAQSTHFLAATSAVFAQVVTAHPTTVSYTVSNLPTVGQTITLTATVLSSAATGTVTFTHGATVICTTGSLVSGQGSCDWTGNPGLGLYNVVATYSGTTDYAASTSAVSVVNVAEVYTVTFANVSGIPAVNYRTGTTAVPLPLPTRSGFVFDGWFDAAQGGNFIGMAATGYTPTASISLYPHWTQLSLSGIAPADLNLLGTINASDFVDATYSATTNGSSVSIAIPQGSLPNQTQVSVHLVGNFDRARALISQTNTYVMTMVISWIAPDGTVPPTDPNKPITMVITNNTIKTGTAVYGLLGGQVTLLGRAVVDGTVTVHITEDPQVVVANTPPTSPITVAATSGLDSRSVISWSEPTNDGGSPVTSYTVTANNGLSCTTTALSCQITGLTNGQSYTFGVVATNVNGESSPSVRASATPISPISAAGLAQTGQDSNSILLFGFLAVLLGFGFVLIRSRIKK